MDELGSREEAELTGLRREMPPPVGMEREILARLANEGLLEPRRGARRWTAALPAIVAAAGLFALGVVLGAALRSAPSTPVAAASPAGPRYVLFVVSPAGPALSAEARRARIEEYRRWSLELGSSGHGLGGEKLAAGGWSLESGNPVAQPPRPEDLELGGYFLFRAADDAEALRLAATHPHLSHRGRLVLRRLEG